MQVLLLLGDASFDAAVQCQLVPHAWYHATISCVRNLMRRRDHVDDLPGFRIPDIAQTAAPLVEVAVLGVSFAVCADRAGQ